MNRVETIAKYFSIWEPTSIVETDQSRRFSRAARSVTTLYYIRSLITIPVQPSFGSRDTMNTSG